jgi:hypothetical protein
VVQKIEVNKEGHVVIRVGDERLNKAQTSRLSGRLLVCDEHGTMPYCYVHYRGELRLCCRKCILENCRLTTAVERPAFKNYDDGGHLMDHPS